MGKGKKKALRRNKAKAIECARKLRKRITPAERILKKELEKEHIIFNFQVPFYDERSCFIIDFFLMNIYGKKYVIEIDGASHDKTKKYDKNRSFKLYHKFSCCVIRFKNEQVYNHLDTVMQKIFSLNPRIIGNTY